MADSLQIKKAQASLETVRKIFTAPEKPNSTLNRLDREISQNLIGFLSKRIVAGDVAPANLEQDFLDTTIPEDPTFVSEQVDFLLSKVVAQSVHTSSPSFVGHMTSALPYFMIPLAKIMITLNQNVVKIETSKAFTPLERQVIGMLHRLVYAQSAEYYAQWTQNFTHSLGVFCSGGTLANITALWVARNRLLGPAPTGAVGSNATGAVGSNATGAVGSNATGAVTSDVSIEANVPDAAFAGVAEEGMAAALRHYGFEGAAVLVSRRGHYSLGKSADLLGLGRRQLIKIPVTPDHTMDLVALRRQIADLRARRIAILAIVGIAGTTETGSVDPLEAMADVASECGAHFHVDAAWGGPTLFSRRHRHLMRGIERADSVTIDAHKQLYVPVGAGIVLFKDVEALSSVEHHANYIIRRGSRDIGKHTLEGSRNGMAMLVHSALRIIGQRGYELLIELGIEKAAEFARLIGEQPDFELVTEPVLNLLTYRYVPAAARARLSATSAEVRYAINEELSSLTESIQKEQRAQGKTFVSRTRLETARYDGQMLTVFRVVLANPLATREILASILQEQREYGERLFQG